MVLSKRKVGVILIVVFSIAIFFVVRSYFTPAKGEILAKQYCASCHVFPQPGLLPKAVWNESVLPQMAFRMGFKDFTIFGQIAPADQPIVTKALPANPMVTDREWELIRNYYLTNAPVSLEAKEPAIEDSLDQFTPVHPTFDRKYITLLSFDSLSSNLYIGNVYAWLYKVDKDFTVLDSLQLNSPPSYMTREGDQKLISLIGILNPNDQSKGKLVKMDSTMTETSLLLDSLQRPVFFSHEDLNNDGEKDFVVCSFGHFTGALLAYENVRGQSKKHILNSTPGARKVVVEDFNNDGRNDILALMAQGDERLVMYINKGNFVFEEKVIKRFPPVYGSNYFELADFNNDGFPDILMTNGDNGDFSMILKPYHGIKILLNDGHNNFNESWSYFMPGASQAIARDFDNDGDPDIAAIAFFPDFEHHPEHSFIYFENRGNNNFTPQTSHAFAAGRWLVMEAGDLDNDGDDDIVLGSLSYKELGAPDSLVNYWKQKATPVLLLRNNRIN